MATAIALAMQAAVEKRSASLQHAVREWSADDSVHTDPPLPPPPIEQEKPPMDQAFAPPVTNGAPASESEAPVNDIVVAGKPDELGPTKAIFFTIRDNPGRSRADLIAALIKAGYNHNSASSIMGTMVSAKLLKYDSQGGLVTTRKKFKPLGSPYKPKSGVDIDRVHKAKKVKRAKPLLPGRNLTRQEAGQLANWMRWEHWGKVAEKYGKEFMQAKRREWRKKHPHYNPAEEARRMGEAIRAGIAAKGGPLEAKRKAAGLPPKEAKPVVKPLAKPTPSVAEKARRAARVLLDKPGTKVHPAAPLQQNNVLDLQGMTADEVIRAMSLPQAHAVFEKLRGFFKD